MKREDHTFEAALGAALFCGIVFVFAYAGWCAQQDGDTMFASCCWYCWLMSIVCGVVFLLIAILDVIEFQYNRLVAAFRLRR